ncbi:VOC family protein [Actinokineospora soli]|uniref:VOC family protein n=1 Tax=Actinokineospora soli TaxID=1048753 RepID=A0ABW2TS02_9PSEU
MSHVSQNQPLGTPTWVDLGIPDLARGQEFYSALFGWEFQDVSGYSFALLDGAKVAGMSGGSEGPDHWWTVYLATDDCAATADRVRASGGRVLVGPGEMADLGVMAVCEDPVGAPFSLWQGKGLVGCERVNEPGTLVRNDLSTADPAPAREFYAAVFDFTLDTNDDLPGMDFTFLRRPDGHEVGGVLGNERAVRSRWSTTFEVADTDSTATLAINAGGKVIDTEDMVYGRFAVLLDPFGAEFSIIARPKD